MIRIALGIEYHGYGFYGWQAQENLPTIQGSLEFALSKIANEKIILYCAGRTDAGVHASYQIAHFTTHSKRPMRAWIHGVNSHLPPSIAVRFAETVDEHFHARFSALARRYRYIIYNKNTRPALLTHQVTWYHETLNTATMQEAANKLIGEHDFSSFRSSGCESRTPMRHVFSLEVTRQSPFVIIEIEANAFLHHMVRNIVGALVRIGAGDKEPEWMEEVLVAKDRRKAAETASYAGLYLINVRYPSSYSFPETENKLLFF